ncbi:MAG TPA: bifunctional uridylyltransferase/uridylyl-removing protein, partial [Alphaproteobacteria bacterium]|nr:bifunctional uridylyltransferase/uridylyl-removing protein [Alphaproteobacteria bacterium]
MNVPIDKLMDAEIDTGMVAVPEIGLPDRDMLAASLRENPDNFAPMSAENRQRVAEFLKSTRQQSMQDIEKALLAGASGPQAVKAIADLHDHMIQALFDYVTQTVFRATNPTSSERICIAAVGGYGRGSLAPESDIDLLFLLPYKQTPWGESVVEFMLYILWDTGLKVGNSTRSVDECVRLSHGDMTIRTALLESRFICGDAELFADLQTRYSADVAADRGMTFVNAKLAERTERHRRQGETRYLVEPNIKEGKGGLRDLHTLYWIAKYIYGIDDVAELVARDVLTKSEFDTFRKAEAFLWLVRCHLHYYTGRPIERLSFDIQPAIAKRLNYADHDGLSAVEWFMKDYFRVAKEVGDLTRIFCAVLEEQHRKPKGIGRFLPRFGRRAIELEAFVAEGGRLNITHESVFTDDPANLLRLFHMAQHNDIDIHPDALRLV